MKKYDAYEEKKPGRGVRSSGFCLCVLILACGLITLTPYALAVGGFLLLALLIEKEIYVTERGLTISYRLLFFQREDVWSFSEIVSIHRERLEGAKITALHFMKGILSRRLLFPPDAADEIVEMARHANRELFFDDIRRPEKDRSA